MDKGKLTLGLCILAGMVFLGLMIPRAASTFRSFERTVSVKGLCEKEVEADKAIWPVCFKVMGNDLATLYAEIEQKNASVVKFLRDGGLQEAEITVAVPAVSDKYAQEYGNNDRAFRYVATSTITVCTSNVKGVLALMDNQASLIKMGIVPISDWDSKPQFNFEGLNDIKPGMIEEATTNAREVAEKFAKDSGSRLGKIKDASQGTFSIESRDSNTPYIKRVRIVTYVTYYLKG